LPTRRAGRAPCVLRWKPKNSDARELLGNRCIAPALVVVAEAFENRPPKEVLAPIPAFKSCSQTSISVHARLCDASSLRSGGSSLWGPCRRQRIPWVESMNVFRAVRKALRLSSIERPALIAAARAECEARGWPWDEPIVVNEGLLEARVATNSQHRGGNANIWIDMATGQVRRAHFVSY
jgi:hypothetical protein